MSFDVTCFLTKFMNFITNRTEVLKF